MVIRLCKALLLPAILYCCLLPQSAWAQLCSGALGDPIVNIKFGGGGDKAVAPAGITPYTQGQGCPKPGTFSIAGLLFGCGSNTWQLLAGDHTRDSEGKYLVLDPNGKPGIIYRDTVTGICGNTNYQFAAYLSNVMRNIACGGQPSLPEVKFSASTLSGQSLGSFTTGKLPIQERFQWDQFGFFFTSPANGSAVILELYLEAGAGCGSAIAVDDITLKACGPLVAARMEGYATNIVELCEGDTDDLVLNATISPGLTDPVSIWQISKDTGKTWTDIIGSNSTRYVLPKGANYGVVLYRLGVAERVNFNSEKCRAYTNYIWTNLYPNPPHTPLTNLVGCLNKDLVLSVATPAKRYHWRGPNGFSFDTSTNITIPSVQSSDAGLYTVNIESEYGCKTLDSFMVNVFAASDINVTEQYNVCEGQTIQFDASGGSTYTWSPATGLSNPTVANPTLTATDSTLYKIVTANTFGCKDSAFVYVNVFRNPIVTVGPDITLIRGDTAVLVSSVSGTAIQYAWTPASDISNPQSLSPQVFPTSDRKYTLTATSGVGCPSDQQSVNIKVYNDIFIPNAFTPNGDGKNDVFRVFPIGAYILQRLNVYDRWGKLVFTTSDPTVSWDGSFKNLPQPPGNYVYYVEWNRSDGKQVNRRGSLMLIR
jgi:gliding motility-associated-like protein